MLQWPVLEMTMMLNLIHSRTKGLEYPTHEEYSHGATLCIPWIPKSPNSRCLCSGMGTHVWEFRLSIQVCVWVLTFSIHIQVVRFRYSDSGIQVWNSDLGIQDWVYRLADKYKALTFSIHIQAFRFGYTG